MTATVDTFYLQMHFICVELHEMKSILLLFSGMMQIDQDDCHNKEV